MNSRNAFRLSLPKLKRVSIFSVEIEAVSVSGLSESRSTYRFSAEKMCLIRSPTVSKRVSLFAPVLVSRILSPRSCSDSCHFWRSQSVYSRSRFRSMSIGGLQTLYLANSDRKCLGIPRQLVREDAIKILKKTGFEGALT